MQGNRAPPQERATPRVRSLTRAAGIQGDEIPDCWYWGIDEVKEYVNKYRRRAIESYELEQGTREETGRFEDVIDHILLSCLERNSTYRVEKNGSLRSINVMFHRLKVPINDLYGALGHFISYAEDYKTSMEMSQAVHICYTRLCYRIGNEILQIRGQADKPAPAVTHMLIVGTFKIFRTADEVRVEGEMSRSHAFSASLPGPVSDPKNGKLKSKSRTLRKELLTNVAGPEATERDRNRHNFGNCAETLNILSHYPTESDPRYHVVASGHALDVSRVRGEFTSYQEIRQRAYKPPCDVCTRIFQEGRVTQLDIGSGEINGPFPNDIEMDPAYAARNPLPRRHADMEAPRPQGHGYGEGRYMNATAGNPIPPISGYQSHPSAPPYMPQGSYETERRDEEHKRGRQQSRDTAGGGGNAFAPAPRGPPMGRDDVRRLSRAPTDNIPDPRGGRSRAPAADSLPGPIRGRSRAPADNIPVKSIPRRAPSSGPRPGPSYGMGGVPPTTMGGQGQERRREPSVGPRPGPSYGMGGVPPSTTTDRSRPPVTNYNIPLRPRARSRAPSQSAPRDPRNDPYYRGGS